jgi:single-strand DNA-binding protein
MNLVVIMGRLTKPPEVSQTQTGIIICKFTLAVDRHNGKNETDFLNITSFGKLAEFVGRYFQKGKQVAINGRIQTRTYDDADGKRHYMTDIIADQAYFADSKDKMPDDYKQSDADETDPF